MASIIGDYLNALPDKRVALALTDAFNRTSHPASTTVAAAGSSSATSQNLAKRHAINAVTGADGTKGVMLPQCRAGDPGVWVINTDATNALKVYPYTGGQINALGTDAALSLAAGQAMFFAPFTAILWYSGIVGATSAQIAFLTGAVAGTAAASKVVVLDASKNIDTFGITTLAAAGATLSITGLAAAQGGAITATGGTSSTGANAGGAVALVGGTPGVTGVGGAASIAGAVGGATSGTGGAATVTGGAGTNGNAVGGAATVTAGAGQGTGAGAVASLVGGASGAGATGNGGAVAVTGGAAASVAGTGGAVAVAGGVGTTTGAGGAVSMTSGAGGTSGLSGAVTIASGVGGTTSASGTITIQTGTVTATAGAASGAITVQTPAGATGSAATTGGASGAITVQSLAGGTSVTGNGGAGGLISVLTGAGGAVVTSTGTGGAGGGFTLTTGAGGATNAVTGGAGGAIAITAGAGGTGTSTGGAAGAITLTAGAGGAGSAVAGGNINLVPGAAASTAMPGEVLVNSVSGLCSANWQQFLSANVPVSGTSYTFFVADRAYRVKAVSTIASSTGAVPTVDVFKDTGTNAPGAGASVLTGATSINTTANTRNTGTIASVALSTLAAGDRLSVKWGGTVGSLTGAMVSALLEPV